MEADVLKLEKRVEELKNELVRVEDFPILFEGEKYNVIKVEK